MKSGPSNPRFTLGFAHRTGSNVAQIFTQMFTQMFIQIFTQIFIQIFIRIFIQIFTQIFFADMLDVCESRLIEFDRFFALRKGWGGPFRPVPSYSCAFRAHFWPFPAIFTFRAHCDGSF